MPLSQVSCSPYFKYLTVTLAVVITTCVMSATPARAEPEHAEPMTVAVKFRLNDILKFDPASGFTVDAFIAFVCDRPAAT